MPYASDAAQSGGAAGAAAAGGNSSSTSNTNNAAAAAAAVAQYKASNGCYSSDDDDVHNSHSSSSYRSRPALPPRLNQGSSKLSGRGFELGSFDRLLPPALTKSVLQTLLEWVLFAAL
jgi:hypothetical protein